MRYLKSIFWFIVIAYRALTEGNGPVTGIFLLFTLIGSLAGYGMLGDYPVAMIVFSVLSLIWGFLASLPMTWFGPKSNMDEQDGVQMASALFGGIVWGATIAICTYIGMNGFVG